MMSRLGKAARLLATSSLFALSAAVAVTGPAKAFDYKTVTDERINNPEPENWLQVRGNNAGWGYSPLKQITAENVKRLVPAWSMSTGVSDGHEAPPIVNNGIMFVSTPAAQVFAVEAATGKVLWRYQRELPPELFQLHPTNRGVGLYGDKVYVTTTDACVVALGAKDGKVAWEHCVADWKDSYYMTLSPMVVKGKVIVGVSGGEFGIRGFITALDTETGKEAWKTYTVASPDDPVGGKTWKGDSWKTGGGPVWVQGSFDPKMNIAYFGTGNGSPWVPESRDGDNLYTTSVIGLDVDTGKMKGYHQYHWNDAWDWDEVSTPLLIDVEKNGRTIPAAVHAGRDGYLWEIERKPDGTMAYLDGRPFVYQDVFKSLDPVSGRPVYNEDKVPHIGVKTNFCPSFWGGKDWPSEAYNPETKLLYIPANENLCAVTTDIPVGARKPGELFIGVPIEGILNSITIRDGVDISKPVNIGQMQAWDLNTGKKVWSHDFQDSFLYGPVLTTGSGLVFAGGTSDRMFRAMDGMTGKTLWETKLNSAVIASPSSFMVDGVQYVSVVAGFGADGDRVLGQINKLLPKDRSVDIAPQGGVVWVFKVETQQSASN